MGPWGARQLETAAKVAEAIEDVQAWGFPRPIDDSELRGAWFRMGRGVVWWYEEWRADMPDAGWVHLAVAPRLHGGAWPVRRWTVAVEIVGEIIGASVLLFAPLPNQGQVVEYLRRLNWKPQGDFMVKPLGG